MRDTRREDQRIDIADIGAGVLHRKFFAQRGVTRKRRIVPAGDRGAEISERAHRGEAGAAQPDDGVASARENMFGKCAHRIFRVARPMRARIIETIQKRMTMVGSAQPFFSK